MTLDQSSQTANVTVELSLAKAVGIAVDASTCNAGASAMPNSTYTCITNVTVGTNHTGATLTVKDADSNTSLASTDDSITSDDAAVSDGSGTWNLTAALASGTSTGTIATPFASQKGITDTDQLVYTTAGAGEFGVDVTYNIGTKVNQKVGSYSDIITYSVKAAV